MKFYVLILCSVLVSCGTRPKTYEPPNSARMDEARHRLGVSVDKATASATKVREHVHAASVNADKVVRFSGTIEVKLGQLHGRVTPELRPVVEDIQNDLSKEKQEESILTDNLTKAIIVEADLAKELGQAQDDKAKLNEESIRYKEEAKLLADNATKERDFRIKAEKSLSWYRWHSWLLKIGAAVIVLVVIVVVVLWLTGNLAKLASRFV